MKVKSVVPTLHEIALLLSTTTSPSSPPSASQGLSPVSPCQAVSPGGVSSSSSSSSSLSTSSASSSSPSTSFGGVGAGSGSSASAPSASAVAAAPKSLPQREKLIPTDVDFLSSFASAGIGAYVTTMDGKFVQCNDVHLSFMQLSRAAIVDKTVFQLAHPDDLPDFLNRFYLLSHCDSQIITFRCKNEGPTHTTFFQCQAWSVKNEPVMLEVCTYYPILVVPNAQAKSIAYN